MRVDDFAYDLPEKLIAQCPLPARGASRLLALDGRTGRVEDLAFPDLGRLLRRGDLLVFNDTRVIRARLTGYKATGGRVEVLVERGLDARRFLAQVRASKTPRLGGTIRLEAGFQVVVRSLQEGFHELELVGEGTVAELVERAGTVPLPPYIKRDVEPFDEARYQTVYARRDGSVAAPTAGLHFDRPFLECLRAAGVELAFVTLHVGAGTFQPLRSDEVEGHRMHRERLVVSPRVCEQAAAARERGGRIVAVGTTSARSLESAATEEGRLAPLHGETRLFIYPGYRFRLVDALLTNFHLPRSTLLMLVCAFAGRDKVLAAYQHAVHHRYRFFSYGDAMFLTRGAP